MKNLKSVLRMAAEAEAASGAVESDETENEVIENGFVKAEINVGDKDNKKIVKLLYPSITAAVIGYDGPLAANLDLALKIATQYRARAAGRSVYNETNEAILANQKTFNDLMAFAKVSGRGEEDVLAFLKSQNPNFSLDETLEFTLSNDDVFPAVPGSRGRKANS